MERPGEGQHGVAPPVSSVILAGTLAGVGLGGFFEGIVFHQVLQWHHMLTGWTDYAPTNLQNLETNTLWDGLFHMFTWVATVAALIAIWTLDRRYDLRWSAVLVGAILSGWGGFNLVEGIVDHHILGVHHVRDDLGAPIEWDIGFLVWGALFVGLGGALIRSGIARVTPRRSTRSR